MTDTVQVDREQLEALCQAVVDLGAKVTTLLEVIGPPPELAAAPAMHPGFARFRQRQGGNRG